MLIFCTFWVLYCFYRTALCDLLNQRIPFFWQIAPFPFLVLGWFSSWIQAAFPSSLDLILHLFEIPLGMLPLVLLWQRGGLGGADVKQGLLFLVAKGFLFTYVSLGLATLFLLPGFWLFRRDQGIRQKRLPLLPCWILVALFC